ncbi:MAG: hypothetical protein ACF8Q5_12720 [Phycisphaerales bacterium JB040]
MPPQPTSPHQPEPNTGRSFKDKLGIYLAGVAIGLMLLAWFQYRKGLARQQQAAQSQAEQSEQDQPASTPPATTEPPTTEPDPG